MSAILPQSIKQSAQEALPIIPDNGNPAGAYNMPRVAVPQQPQQAAPQPTQDPYSFTKASPYMGEVQKSLFAYDQFITSKLQAPQEEARKQRADVFGIPDLSKSKFVSSILTDPNSDQDPYQQQVM